MNFKSSDLLTAKQCTLKNAKTANIGGKSFCLANVARKRYSEAHPTCKSLNAKLPLPRNPTENQHLLVALINLLGFRPSPSNPVVVGVTDSAKGKNMGKVIKKNFYFCA